jgi:peptidoglycan/xylan/chitin deacetylase (PgdA/CDA1 family)
MAVTANPRPIPILVYHQIDAAPPKGAPFRSLYVSPAAFGRQMALLKALGFSGLSMGDLLPYLRGELSGRVVGITFDDGYLNNLTHALPVLQRHRFTSTCYAVSAQAGRTNVWDQSIGIEQVSLMSQEQMQQWVAGGQEIGAHTRQHVHLPALSQADCQQEIAGSREDLRALLGCSVAHFCYPYGDYQASHVQQVQDAGFASATTTARGRCHAGAALLELPRVPVMRSTSLLQFWLKVQSSYEDRKRG